MTEPTTSSTLPAATVPSQGSVMVCLTCGAAAPSDPPPLTWSAGTERGRRVWTCGACMRANIRSIEGKLDSAWW
ncbi:hypothetical protein [Kineosporia sp. A_224]|uniref:hypothetical protein n=1 Tax=Kineosporia sp. A_224 TaxID=1962180 RepID=UPI00117AFC98|nr:hypothetical protein [Kineosporia sp. A_224]